MKLQLRLVWLNWKRIYGKQKPRAFFRTFRLLGLPSFLCTEWKQLIWNLVDLHKHKFFQDFGRRNQASICRRIRVWIRKPTVFFAIFDCSDFWDFCAGNKIRKFSIRYSFETSRLSKNTITKEVKPVRTYNFEL